MADGAPPHSSLAGIGLRLVAPPGGRVPPSDRLLDEAVAAAVAAEAVGLGSVWVTESGATPGADTPYEAYSLLGALAARTDKVHLGAVPDDGRRRAPSILAKIVTGVDVLSHGRAVLALDGDGADEADGERLSEALTVCRVVLIDDHPTFTGRIYSVSDAVNRPAPVQEGGIPVVVFLHGGGPGRAPVLDVAARLADAVVVDGGADGVRDACRAVAARADAGDGPDGGPRILGRVDGAADGTADGAVAEVRAAGATGCLVGLPYPWDPAAVQALAGAW